MATLLSGIKAGRLHQGYFNANVYNYLEVGIAFFFTHSGIDKLCKGSVNVPSFPKPVLITGREHMNRSVHGDLVVIEMLPESEWKSSADEVLDQDGESHS